MDYFKKIKEENFYTLFNDKKTLFLLEGYFGNEFPLGQSLLETPSDYFYLAETEYFEVFEEINSLNILVNQLDEILNFDDIQEAVYTTWGVVKVWILTYVAHDFEDEEYSRHKDQMNVQEFVYAITESDVSHFSADEKREFTFSFAAFIMHHEGKAVNNIHQVFQQMNIVLGSMPELVHDSKLEKRKNSSKFTNSGSYSVKVLLNKIDKMEGVLFEKFLGELYENMGYSVEYTPATGDQGIDLLCRKDGRLIGVQAKRYSKNVSNSAVQEAMGGKVFYDLDEAIVFTNSSFTKSAKELSERAGILLYDRDNLKELVKEYM